MSPPAEISIRTLEHVSGGIRIDMIMNAVTLAYPLVSEGAADLWKRFGFGKAPTNSAPQQPGER